MFYNYCSHFEKLDVVYANISLLNVEKWYPTINRHSFLSPISSSLVYLMHL